MHAEYQIPRTLSLRRRRSLKHAKRSLILYRSQLLSFKDSITFQTWNNRITEYENASIASKLYPTFSWTFSGSKEFQNDLKLFGGKPTTHENPYIKARRKDYEPKTFSPKITSV